MSKEKDERINVFVRVKPVKEINTSGKCATTMIDVTSDKEITICLGSQDKTSKKFTFDRVFGPSASQVNVYKVVVSPLLKQVIAGYNCTVFAYGQTGTGKTYTMEGDRVNDFNLHWQSDTSAGMIPRCISQLFEELQMLDNQRYTVRVTFLELYNEELYDLLTTDGNVTSKIKLYEDVTRKGSVIVHGLEEITVRDKTEIYKILAKGSDRRQIATTLLNANSSRSHTVFSITLHINESTSDGEELLKTAKLNLVDLAGNESVGRCGISDKKAREAKSINQSLLTLGRVITALVEKAPHVPYRESKLTRVLQDSLGGRTKTSIIATISSASGNFEETLSTLDYAYRAKIITNYPKINEVLCRKALLKEYTKEIERLKRDLAATREKNGVNLSLSSYDAMKTLIDCQRVEIKEKRECYKALEKIMRNKEVIYRDLQSQYDIEMYELAKSTSELEDMNRLLQSTKHTLQRTKDDMNEQKYLMERYVQTEGILFNQAEVLLNVVNEVSEDARKLHDKLDCQIKMEEENEKLGLQIKTDFIGQCKNIEEKLSAHKEIIHTLFQSIKNEVETYVTSQVESIAIVSRSVMQSVLYQHFAASRKFKRIINASYTHYREALNVHISISMRQINEESKLLTDIYVKLAPYISDLSRYNDSCKQNLQVLHKNVTQKLESASTYAKLVIDTICKNRLEECNYLCKNLNEISEQIDRMSRNEKQMMENYKKFGKKMEDLSHEFDLLSNCETSYFDNINKSHQIDKVCNKMCDQTLQNYNDDTHKQKDLNDFLYVTHNIIKSNFDNNARQTQMLNKIEREIISFNDVQEHLSTGCITLKQYDNNVQFNGKQLQRKMIKDKSTMLTSTSANILKTVENEGFSYARFLEQRQNKISDISKKINDKFAIQSVELNNWNNNILEELHASKRQIDKLSMNDICQNISTGTTPKKIYLYSREFAKTSPERIVQTFREIRKHMDKMEDLDLIR